MPSLRPRRQSAAKAEQKMKEPEPQVEDEEEEQEPEEQVDKGDESNSDEDEAMGGSEDEEDEESGSEEDEEEENTQPKKRPRPSPASKKAAPPKKKSRTTQNKPSKEDEEDDDDDDEEEEEDSDEGEDIDEAEAEKNMAFEKGTFLLRLDDLKTKRGCIWRVDNYQLLQRFDPVTKGAKATEKTYERSQNYTGWLCHQKAKFLALDVQSMKDNGRKVTIRYPSKEQLATAAKDNVNSDNEDDDEESVQNGNRESSEERDVSPPLDSVASSPPPPELVESLGDHFDIYLQALLSQAVDKTFLEDIEESKEKDAYFTNAMEKIETETAEKSLEKLSERVEESVRKQLDEYPVWTTPSKGTAPATDFSQCKNCDKSGCVKKVLMLESQEWEDLEKLLSDGDVCVAIPLCEPCAALAEAYHSLRHMRFRLFKEACRKLALVKSEKMKKDDPDMVKYIMGNSRDWLDSIQAPFYKMFDKVEKDGF